MFKKNNNTIVKTRVVNRQYYKTLLTRRRILKLIYINNACKTVKLFALVNLKYQQIHTIVERFIKLLYQTVTE